MVPLESFNLQGENRNGIVLDIKGHIKKKLYKALHIKRKSPQSSNSVKKICHLSRPITSHSQTRICEIL